MPHSSTESREYPRPQTLFKVNSNLSLCFSLIWIFSQYKIVNGYYRDSDSLRVINKLWLNVNSDNTFEVSKTCIFCQETNIENVCLYLIPGLEVTELQQSHYTIHLKSETAPSLPDHLLVTAVAWERLLLSRFSNTWEFAIFPVKFYLVLLSIPPFFLFPPNLEQMVLSNSDVLFSGCPYFSPQIQEWVDCLDSPYHLIKPGLLFCFFHPGTKLSCRVTFLKRQHFAVLSPFFQSQLNYHWAPGTDCFQENSMNLGTQINCKVHILALEGIFIFRYIVDLLLGTWYENWQRDRVSIIPK